MNDFKLKISMIKTFYGLNKLFKVFRFSYRLYENLILNKKSNINPLFIYLYREYILLVRNNNISTELTQ